MQQGWGFARGQVLTPEVLNVWVGCGREAALWTHPQPSPHRLGCTGTQALVGDEVGGLPEGEPQEAGPGRRDTHIHLPHGHTAAKGSLTAVAVRFQCAGGQCGDPSVRGSPLALNSQA